MSNFSKNPIVLQPMNKSDIEEASQFVGIVMNAEEEAFALKTMTEHFKGAAAGLDDGRDYYVWKNNDMICGLVGLHHYIWGPPENVWLGWFGVSKKLRRQGHGSQLMRAIEYIAADKGYRKLFVETYSSDTFTEARAFYAAVGFEEVGRINCYLPDGSGMVVYMKTIQKKS